MFDCGTLSEVQDVDHFFFFFFFLMMPYNKEVRTSQADCAREAEDRTGPENSPKGDVDVG